MFLVHMCIYSICIYIYRFMCDDKQYIHVYIQYMHIHIYSICIYKFLVHMCIYSSPNVPYMPMLFSHYSSDSSSSNESSRSYRKMCPIPGDDSASLVPPMVAAVLRRSWVFQVWLNDITLYMCICVSTCVYGTSTL
jgi:hypothetical protein